MLYHWATPDICTKVALDNANVMHLEASAATLMVAHSALICHQDVPLPIKQVDMHRHPLVDSHGSRHLVCWYNIALDESHGLHHASNLQGDRLQNRHSLSDTLLGPQGPPRFVTQCTHCCLHHLPHHVIGSNQQTRSQTHVMPVDHQLPSHFRVLIFLKNFKGTHRFQGSELTSVEIIFPFSQRANDNSNASLGCAFIIAVAVVSVAEPFGRLTVYCMRNSCGKVTSYIMPGSL